MNARESPRQPLTRKQTMRPSSTHVQSPQSLLGNGTCWLAHRCLHVLMCDHGVDAGPPLPKCWFKEDCAVISALTRWVWLCSGVCLQQQGCAAVPLAD